MDSAAQHPLFTNSETKTYTGKPVPEMRSWLERDLGMNAVWRLTRAFGGRHIHLPRPSRRKSVLDEPLGRDLVAWLYQQYGSGDLLIPMGPCAPKLRDAVHVLHLRREGMSTAQIAKTLQCHVRNVGRITSQLTRVGFLPETEPKEIQ